MMFNVYDVTGDGYAIVLPEATEFTEGEDYTIFVGSYSTREEAEAARDEYEYRVQREIDKVTGNADDEYYSSLELLTDNYDEEEDYDCNYCS
jgi:hypothetical protein